MSTDEKANELRGKYIGQNRISAVRETSEKTPGVVDIVEVEYKNGTVEHFSSLMLNKVVSDHASDLSKLRDLRVQPVVEIVLQIMRDWGVRLADLSYFSTVLMQSLDYNHKEALNILLSQWMPKPKEPDEIDMITIDRILKHGN